MNNLKKDKPIYLDAESYKKFLAGIEELKEKLNKNNKERKAAFDAGAGDGWDSPEFEEIERCERLILGELHNRYEELSRIVIVEKKEDSQTVDIGDVVKLNMILPNGKTEEKIFKLVGGMPDLNSDIKEISVNSPIGAAIYQKPIGETCTYLANNRQFTVFIQEKIDYTKEQNGPTKILKK